MKRINKTINTCKECPYCYHDRFIYMYVCNLSGLTITHETHKIDFIADFCELEDENLSLVSMVPQVYEAMKNLVRYIDKYKPDFAMYEELDPDELIKAKQVLKEVEQKNETHGTTNG